MRRSTLGWLVLALALGGATWLGVRLYGSGPLRGDAVWLGVVAGLAGYLARYIRLKPPTDRHSRRRTSLTARAKSWLMVIFAGCTLGALALAIVQGLQGYAELTPAALLTGQAPPSTGFFIAEGRPQLEALYRLGGPDGERFLVPLEAYEGRLLIVVDQMPPTTAVRVSGRLRTDIRTVQTGADGRSEGPFLPLYREHLRLPSTAKVYFLDTGVRAGLNLRAVLMVLVPGFLFLLMMGAPTRAPPRGIPRRSAQRGRR